MTGRWMGLVLVFDLDDTLYDELTYVHSGFRAVSSFLEAEYNLPAEASFPWMMERLAGGRGTIFDDLLRTYGMYSKGLVWKCVSVYRGHKPDIRLSEGAVKCLERFRDYPKYTVTDGNKIVQTNKIKALGLTDVMKGCFVTHRYGIRHAKPSPYCFMKICEREKVPPQEIVYIGDNPRKDFVGLKPLGFKTVRVLQGQHRDLRMPAEYEAEYQIQSLDELTEEFLESLQLTVYS